MTFSFFPLFFHRTKNLHCFADGLKSAALVISLLSAIGFHSAAICQEDDSAHPAPFSSNDSPSPSYQADQTDSSNTEDDSEPFDPFESVNRVVFEFNNVVEGMLLNPLVHMYKGAVPVFFQRRIHNVLLNLATPVYFLNDLLQFEFEQAGQSLTRFCINSTFGILGLFDIAAEAGIPPHNSDFGQTLGRWGATPGFYIVLPIIGPTDFRGLLGMVADFFADPFNYWAIHSDHENLLDARIAFAYLDERSQYVNLAESITKTSIDPYANIRSLYWQHKRMKILGQDNGPSPISSGRPQIEED